jgi:catechol 2,3-dioxygenase-like lactoylglutathione lyase family enzyme
LAGPDRITANLPAIDLDKTEAFCAALGFDTGFKDDGWMILSRGGLEIEFLPYPDINPRESSFSACVRVAGLDVLLRDWLAAGLPGFGVPRLTAPILEPFGLRMFARIDPNGSLLRCIEEPATYSIGLFLRISPMLQVFDMSRRFSENRFPLFGTPL